MGAITLQFVGNHSFGSELIAWFGKGVYSHVDSVLPDGSLLGARDDVIDGIPAGVQIRPATYVASYPEVKRIVIPCTDQQEVDYYAFVKAQIGKKYDELAIAAFFVGTQWTTLGEWFCSMLVTAGLELVKIFEQLCLPPTKVDPDTLMLIISAIVAIPA
jgi:hypothetical protein